MKALFTNDQLKAGVKFKGNVNGAIFEIIQIESSVRALFNLNNTPGPYMTKTAIIKDCKTGIVFQYGLEALKRCNITILKEAI